MSNKENDKLIDQLVETFKDVGGKISDIPQGLTDFQLIIYLKNNIKKRVEK